MLIFVDLEMFRIAPYNYAPVALEIRASLTAIQFQYVVVDKLCDLFIIFTTEGHGLLRFCVDLHHLIFNLVGFFCMYWCR